MSIDHTLKRAVLPAILIGLAVFSVSLVGSLKPTAATPTGVYFDHIVVVAMENSAYSAVLGSGTLTTCPVTSAPFLCSMLPASSTIPRMDNYGATSADSNDFNGCSAACYVGLMLGYTYGVSDGYSLSSISSNPQFVNILSSAGLSWQAYCAEGCPRGPDHFPFSGSNTFTSSSVTTSTFVAAANSANPPNFLWYTPTDSENMHDVSASTGDSYLQSFLVGTGSLASPASGSLLASNDFTNPSFRTVLYLWWDECGGSNGSCDSNNDAPNLLYGNTVKKGYVSPDSTGIDEYASLWTIENNWGISPVAQGDTAAKNNGYQFNDVFTSATPLPLSASFAVAPASPVVNSPVRFTPVATGGKPAYSFAWNYGDGSTGIGLTAVHTYTSTGSYNVALTVTDSTGGKATSTQTVQASPIPPLTASFTISPSSPVSGQTVTFTAIASGGTSPYSYSWNLAGTTNTGNTVSQTFTNGTYAISMTVTDSASQTVTTSKTLIVQPPSTGGGPVPVLVGWGGVRMDESVAGTAGTSSAVFSGEYASNMELLLMELKAKGYDSVRVNFDPYCTDTVDFNYMSVYSETNAQRAVAIAKYYGFWIIIDYHGYSDIFLNTSCWLNYWQPIVQNIGPLYSNIIWEPENEPTLSCANSPSSCPSTAPCSSDSSCVTYLGGAYQQWIDQARSMGDNHWIVVQNLCSYSCGFSDFSQGYPTVTDPLGTLSQGGKIFISLHSYMDYSQYSGSWTNSTAESVAQQYYRAVVAGVANTGWPALNTEGGTDTLSCDPNLCGPDIVLDGSAGYTVVTFHFIQTLVNLYDSNAARRINWLWWPAGSWTNTPGSGVYGAMQCNSNPIGWGCLLTFVPPGPPVPDFGITASTAPSVNVGQSATTTVAIATMNGFSGTVTLRDTVPSGLSCGSISNPSITGSGSATISCSASSAGSYQLTIIGTSGSLVHSVAATFNFQDFSLSSNPASVSINSGAQGTSIISLNLLNGFTSGVLLMTSTPTGLNTSLDSSNISGSGTATLTITPSQVGSYDIVVTGTSGSLTRTVTITVSVGNVASPQLTVPSTKTVAQTATVSFAVNASDSSVPTPTLTLSASRIPSNAHFATVQGTSPVSSTFSWTPMMADAPGTYNISFTVTNGVSSSQAYVVITVVSADLLPVITVPSAQNATVGGKLHFTVSANDPTGTGGAIVLSATGLVSNMAFDPASGDFSFTPGPSQAGQTFIVNFTATDSNDPTYAKTESVPIRVQGSSAQTSGGGFCLSCLLPRTMTTTAWLIAVGALIGIVSSIALLHLRATAEIAAAKKRMMTLNSRDRTGRNYANYGTRRQQTAEVRPRRRVIEDHE